jgi:hypothetical protein
MSNDQWNERIVERMVTYVLRLDGKIAIFENVPARVDLDTGEEYFSPRTVERLQQLAMGEQKPVRTIEAPVYNFAA